tara:strand:+ start:547 stop:693 length:147 start_codon:yes stop_codon:yes gene_type:complete
MDLDFYREKYKAKNFDYDSSFLEYDENNKLIISGIDHICDGLVLLNLT